LLGFDRAAPKQFFRRFVETAGLVQIEKDRIIAHFENQLSAPGLL
jgi:hypothetical protein